MDLLSLPDEMVASILKYKDFSTVRQLRAVNSRINKVAKGYELGVRFPVTAIQFAKTSFRRDFAGKLWKYSPVSAFPVCVCHMGKIKAGSLTIFTKHADLSIEKTMDAIDEILKRVDLYGPLIFATSSLVFDDQLLEVFAKNQKNLRNMVEFGLCNATVECSDSSLRNFVASTRKIRFFDINTQRLDVFCQTEMFENRYWDEIWLANNNADITCNYPFLNDEFLLKVAKNCRKFYIGFE